MAGLDEPTSGRVCWPALEPGPLRPGPVAIVFQGPSLLPALSASENVALPLVLAGVPHDAAQQRASEALASLGLSELGEALPDELSGGQAQRVAVARVLVARPRLILADEPTSQLDHHAARTVVELLEATARDAGAALVVATHDPAVAVAFEQEWPVVDGELEGYGPAAWSR
jgi:ABC-type lipoprotein export system ATPase subunit